MKFESTTFVIKEGDITKEQVDAIVNATNSQLCGGGGVDAAIHRAGGPAIAAELKQIVAQIKTCRTGDAVITCGGKMKAQHVIHAVGPIWHGGKKGEKQLLEDAYLSSLILAKEYGAKTVAFPAISAGSYGYPVEEAAQVAVETCKSFATEHQCFDEIRFVLFSPEMLSTFQAALAKAA